MLFQKILILFLTATTLFFSTAQADVTGTWQGRGQWAYDGSAVPCILTMHFLETQTSLQRHEGVLDCNLVTMYSDPLTWTKDGSQLILNGTPAGTWGPSGFKSREMANNEVEVETEFDILTGKYQESWRKLTDGAIIYKIDAKLEKK